MNSDDRDPAVTRALAASTRRPDADLSACNDDELLASAIYADEVATAMLAAKVALWAALADRPGWTYGRVANRVGAARSTVHDTVQRYLHDGSGS